MTGGGSLLYFLIASLVVILLTCGASRMVGRWQKVQGKGRRLRVLEGVSTGKDRSLLLVAVGKEVLVVADGPAGTTLVHRIEDPQAAEALCAPEADGPLAGAAADFPAERSIRANLERMQSLIARRRTDG
ncbi:MAG: fliO [Symbiobacteriaceae bacterium]|jgi:flagellar biogenesis protein FliO|nr:fliO [Symbiobacteriaceae bacterium]